MYPLKAISVRYQLGKIQVIGGNGGSLEDIQQISPGSIGRGKKGTPQPSG
jgi:hypothetical protein